MVAAILVGAAALGLGVWAAWPSSPAAAPAAAPDARPPPAPPQWVDAPDGAGPRGQQAGRVLLGEILDDGGAPIASARVRAEAGGLVRTANTDSDGQFVLDGLPAQLDALVFTAPGHRAVRVEGSAVPAAAEAFWSQVLVRDVDGRAVRVFFVDAAGRRQPVARAAVHIERNTDDSGDGAGGGGGGGAGVAGVARRTRGAPFELVGTTDAQGTAALASAAEGGEGAAARAASEATWEVFVGHVAHGAVAARVPPRGPPVDVELPAGAVLSGRVVGTSGPLGPDDGARVTLAPQVERDAPAALRALVWSVRGAPVAVLDDAGHFEEPLGALSWRVEASATGHRPGEPVLIALAPGARREVTLTLEPSPTLRGRVVEEGTGAPLGGARVGIDVPGPPVFSDADGRFEIARLPARAVSVTAQAPGHESVTVGGVEAGMRALPEIVIALPRGSGGSVVGIGVTVAPDPEGGARIRAVEQGSPAAVAGIAGGERIVAVDRETIGDAFTAAMARIRGQPGTTVEIVVESEAGLRRTLTVERTRIALPPPPVRRRP